MITLTQSNSFPMTLAGVVAYNGAPLGSGITGGINNVPQPTAPIQVLGFVPLYPCCEPTPVNNCATFKIWQQGNVSGICWGASFIDKVNNSPYGTGCLGLNWTLTQTCDQIKNTINNLASPFPYVASYTIVGNVATFQICCPNTPTYNGAYVNFSICCNPGENGGSVFTSPCTSFTENSGTGKVHGCELTLTFNTVSIPAPINCADCRYGKYLADTPPDDRNWTLPVFALLGTSDSYHNDVSPFLLSYPSGYNPISKGDFTLQKFNGTTWSNVATLNNAAYGFTITNFFGGVTCSNVKYYGYEIDWNKVLKLQGVGYYRFSVNGNFVAENTYCFNSPPFCLQVWDCNAVSNTVKFEATYSGGNFGSVTTQGLTYTMCCTNGTSTVPVTWSDSIRFYGFFGRETSEYQRDQIKYANGSINKIRDELIHKYELRAGGDGGSSQRMPAWLNQRFSAYGLMADKLYVSDYALNNSEYEKYKHFWIVADGDYAPQYTNSSRYTKVKVLFKEGQQLVYRDRCCG